MLGAIAGDIIGSIYEKSNLKSTKFPLFSPQSRFTDDTVLTVAVADCVLNDLSYSKTIRKYGRNYPMAGYGRSFKLWLTGIYKVPYNSYGNGSAMRVSPIGWAYEHLVEVNYEARISAEVTHNHPEGVKGAQAIATAIFFARRGYSKPVIRQHITETYGYDLNRTIESIRPDYQFDVSCQGSVPEAIIAFLDGKDFEDTIRLAISLGGDADTLACMAGAIAEAFYEGIPPHIEKEVRNRLPKRFLKMVDAFYEAFG
ncbi:MAG: ADP-ribosylglycohydrolase family protein [Bacteroidota bacterium]